MSLLAGTTYDPGTQVTKAVSAALAMTAFDTTNLRLSFTVPANGAVLVRQRCTMEGGTSTAVTHLGVLEGSTVRARAPVFGTLVPSGSALGRAVMEALYVVPGLTPAAGLTWDAAYGVDTIASGSTYRYGGPNNTTADDAAGGFSYEIYDCANLLGAVLYDPTTQVSKATTALLAMTVIDTTNLRITFTAPASGNVLVRMRCTIRGAGAIPVILLGVLDGSTIRGRVTPSSILPSAVVDVMDANFIVKGLTASTSYTWDAAYGVEGAQTSTNITYGGPNDATANNAGGAFQYEIWAV